jgi:hypothetical protein
MPKEKWAQEAFSGHTKGALHRQLGIPETEKIPKKTLRDIVDTDIGKKSHGHTVTLLLKQRANAALNINQKRKK